MRLDAPNSLRNSTFLVRYSAVLSRASRRTIDVLRSAVSAYWCVKTHPTSLVDSARAQSIAIYKPCASCVLGHQIPCFKRYSSMIPTPTRSASEDGRNTIAVLACASGWCVVFLKAVGISEECLSNLRISNFEFVSDFVLRISHLPALCRRWRPGIRQNPHALRDRKSSRELPAFSRLPDRKCQERQPNLPILPPSGLCEAAHGSTKTGGVWKHDYRNGAR